MDHLLGHFYIPLGRLHLRADKDRLEKDTEQQQQPVELDEKELKKYVDFVIREVKERK
jgi:hypothetical protein